MFKQGDIDKEIFSEFAEKHEREMQKLREALQAAEWRMEDERAAREKFQR